MLAPVVFSIPSPTVSVVSWITGVTLILVMICGTWLLDVVTCRVSPTTSQSCGWDKLVTMLTVGKFYLYRVD